MASLLFMVTSTDLSKIFVPHVKLGFSHFLIISSERLYELGELEKQHFRKKSLYFKSGKRGIIENKGAQNAREEGVPTTVKGANAEWDSYLSEVYKEHSERVDAEKPRLLANPFTDPDLKAHIASADANQGIINIRATNNGYRARPLHLI